jgi:uncharacterized protein YraI
MKRLLPLLFVLLVLFVVPLTAAAQSNDACRAFVQAAVETVRKSCAETGLNTLCYGYPPLEWTPREGAATAFADVGDSVSLAQTQSLTGRPFDLAAKTWGAALLRLRTDLPDQVLVMLAFGDTTLQNQSDTADDFLALAVQVSGTTGANLRESPSVDAPLVRSLYSGDALTAIGRLADGTWLRLPEGWVAAELVRSAYDLSLLPVMAADAPAPEVLLAPMQAFRFRSAFEDASCLGAPDSGLLLQAPDGVTNVRVVVNGAELIFGGTLYLQTTNEGRTVLTVLEGGAVYADGETLETGERLTYGYQGETVAYDAPEDYNFARARYLPLQLLPREFELTFSLGGLLYPFTPGTGFLTTIAADARCTVAWSVDVNLRSGPGTAYPIRHGVAAGFYGYPDARALDSEGRMWWRLAEAVWLAVDNTAGAGACDQVPIIEAPPLPAK